MKKYTLLFVVVIAAVFHATAQTSFGLTVGANATNMQGNGIKNTLNTGFIAGGFSRITLNKKWSLQPELLFNLENAKKADNFINFYNNKGNPYADASIKLSYVSVPVLVNYKLNKLFSLSAGPQFSVLAYDDEDLVNTTKATAYKGTDVGVVGGGQIQLDNLSFFARYVYGIANINNIDNRYKWNNTQVQVGLNLALW